MFASNQALRDAVRAYIEDGDRTFGPIGTWDVSNVTDMSSLFRGYATFNEPLSEWDVSQVTDMSFMFHECHAFNQPLSAWNVRQVTNMSFMFYKCRSFNQPLSGWDVSQATSTVLMFLGCRCDQIKGAPGRSPETDAPPAGDGVAIQAAFATKQALRDAVRAYIEDGDRTFGPIGTWDVSNVTDMSSLFRGYATFNEPLSEWDVSQVTCMGHMFNGCQAFNQPLAAWDVSRVTDMSYMFFNCNMFDKPLSNWDVSQVIAMKYMFYRCYTFNQPLSKWNVSRVTCMFGMFYLCLAFNQPLNCWNVGHVTDMRLMFCDCRAFDQSLSDWDVSRVTDMDNSTFYQCKMQTQFKARSPETNAPSAGTQTHFVRDFVRGFNVGVVAGVASVCLYRFAVQDDVAQPSPLVVWLGGAWVGLCVVEFIVNAK